MDCCLRLCPTHLPPALHRSSLLLPILLASPGPAVQPHHEHQRNHPSGQQPAQQEPSCQRRKTRPTRSLIEPTAMVLKPDPDLRSALRGLQGGVVRTPSKKFTQTFSTSSTNSPRSWHVLACKLLNGTAAHSFLHLTTILLPSVRRCRICFSIDITSFLAMSSCTLRHIWSEFCESWDWIFRRVANLLP